MSDYLELTSSLSSDWTDDQTIGTLLDQIKQMKASVEELMDEILSIYPGFFKAKAEQIRNRPKF